MISASLTGTKALDRSKATVNVATRAAMPSPILRCRSEMAGWMEDACTNDLDWRCMGRRSDGVLSFGVNVDEARQERGGSSFLFHSLSSICHPQQNRFEMGRRHSPTKSQVSSLRFFFFFFSFFFFRFFLTSIPFGWAKPDRH
eukprot:scaffold1049_cov430-Pinguiococcus_pyrenoidosus.AAC.3